jgi:hypothetical protein
MLDETASALVQSKDELDEIIEAINEKLDTIVEQSGITLSNGETVTSWKGLLAERDKHEIAIKEAIKSGTPIHETKFFIIQTKVSNEYDPKLLRDKIGDAAELFIERKESVKKTDLDKAVKAEAVSVEALDALVTKSVSVSFKRREEFSDLSVVTL